MDKFIKQLEEVFEKEPGSIKGEDNFREYDEWDSLVILSLMVMLEDEYGRTIPRDSFDKIVTVQQLFDFVTQ